MSESTKELYAAQPAPVYVPDFGALTKCIVQRLVDYGAADDDAIASARSLFTTPAAPPCFSRSVIPNNSTLR